MKTLLFLLFSTSAAVSAQTLPPFKPSPPSQLSWRENATLEQLKDSAESMQKQAERAQRKVTGMRAVADIEEDIAYEAEKARLKKIKADAMREGNAYAHKKKKLKRPAPSPAGPGKR